MCNKIESTLDSASLTNQLFMLSPILAFLLSCFLGHSYKNFLPCDT